MNNQQGEDKEKGFNLFRFLFIATIVCTSIAALGITGAIAYEKTPSYSEMGIMLGYELELKNWHYALLILTIWSRK